MQPKAGLLQITYKIGLMFNVLAMLSGCDDSVRTKRSFIRSIHLFVASEANARKD